MHSPGPLEADVERLSDREVDELRCRRGQEANAAHRRTIAKSLHREIFRERNRVRSEVAHGCPCRRDKPDLLNQQQVKATAARTELRFDRWFLPLSVPLGLGPKNSELRVEAGNLHIKMGPIALIAACTAQ